VVDLPLRFGRNKDAAFGGTDLPTDRPTRCAREACCMSRMR